MKLFFTDQLISPLADKNSFVLKNTRKVLLANKNIEEVYFPEEADIILIQEKNSFKNFNYINELLADPFISKFANTIFTINDDDCATGLLKGLYTSLPKSRFNPKIHVAIPYMEYPNELVFSNYVNTMEPSNLASWRGNTKSNNLRLKLLRSLNCKAGIILEKTDSWLNHTNDEKETYVNLIKNSKFSLCPAGWAPVSFRIYESMALGRCPVILADDFVPPVGPNWNEFALFFPENKIINLFPFLLKHEKNYNKYGKNSFNAWNEFFSPENIGHYYANAILKLIHLTPKCSKENEIKRWKSLSMQWNNKWTMPQRVLNKVKKIVYH